MYSDSERIETLLTKHIQGTLTREERLELDRFLARYPRLKPLHNELGKESFLYDVGDFIKIPIPDQASRRISERPGIPWRIFGRPTYLKAAAAVLITFSLVSVFLLRDRWMPQQAAAVAAYPNDVPPGTDRAILTLDDGRTINLNEAQKGIIVEDGITYLDGSQVFGEQGSEETSKRVQLTTPKGGQYEVTLPDGSTAWLNAESTLRFPSRFSDEERAVEAVGEIYFDIRENPTLPFRVKLPNDVRIEVLGTEFNVRSYMDEPAMKTTLRSGAIKIGAASYRAVLKPGEQASFTPHTADWNIAAVDVEAETAWKAGFFYFKDAPLDEIMLQLARWYNVEVDFVDPINETFEIMMMPRSVTLSKLLNLMELTGHVRFKIEGRRVTVMK